MGCCMVWYALFHVVEVALLGLALLGVVSLHRRLAQITDELHRLRSVNNNLACTLSERQP